MSGEKKYDLANLPAKTDLHLEFIVRLPRFVIAFFCGALRHIAPRPERLFP
jgi:hypothetical protein